LDAILGCGVSTVALPCNENIREVLRLAGDLDVLADNGEANGRDPGCLVLYGVVRDCAQKIRSQAEREREAHRAAGIWDTDDHNGDTEGRRKA